MFKRVITQPTESKTFKVYQKLRHSHKNPSSNSIKTTPQPIQRNFSREKRLLDGQSDIFNQSPNRSMVTRSPTPLGTKDSTASAVNENAHFDRNYSRNMKLKADHGNLSLDLGKQYSNSAQFQGDGNAIIPTTIPWNAFDSIAYRRARLRINDHSAPKLENTSAFKKLIKEKQSSLDQHKFYQNIEKRTQPRLESEYKCSQDKIEAFLNGSVEVYNRNAITPTSRTPQGAVSNNLYNITTPKQIYKEPQILNFEIKNNKNADISQFKEFCKEKGWGLVRMNEDKDNLSHQPKGTGAFTIRVKEPLNNEDEVKSFFQDKGIQVKRNYSANPKHFR